MLDADTIRRYRIRMKNHRPGHVWEELEDGEFLYRLGALGRGEDSQLHPTAAGLLMFGFEYEIVKERNQIVLSNPGGLHQFHAVAPGIRGDVLLCGRWTVKILYVAPEKLKTMIRHPIRKV